MTIWAPSSNRLGTFTYVTNFVSKNVYLVGTKGVEPLISCERRDLNPECIPIPPRSQMVGMKGVEPLRPMDTEV